MSATTHTKVTLCSHCYFACDEGSWGPTTGVPGVDWGVNCCEGEPEPACFGVKGLNDAPDKDTPFTLSCSGALRSSQGIYRSSSLAGINTYATDNTPNTPQAILEPRGVILRNGIHIFTMLAAGRSPEVAQPERVVASKLRRISTQRLRGSIMI